MKLEDQVCSLELAQKLLTLGIEQHSLFCWCGEGKYIQVMLNYTYDSECNPNFKICSAFTAAELGELLPNCILKPDAAPFDNYRLTIRKFISVDEKINHTNNFIINYECDSTEISGADAWLTRKLSMNIYDSNLANAIAKMLIHLK